MPTHLVRKWAAELAKRLRNLPEYDDFEYGTEVIPGDKTWVKKCNKCKTCSCTIGSKKAETPEQIKAALEGAAFTEE